jgi:uncharacterized membrane protein
MNLKRIFGTILTILGCFGLIYSAYHFINNESSDWRTILVFFVLGLIFFSSGLGLLKGTADKS